MNTKPTIVYVLLFVLCPLLAFSQSLENIKAKAEDDKVIITYDLVSDNSDFRFNVEIYSSDNNYRSPLALVSGDVGKEVAPGKGKRVVWDAGAELKRFQGNITFEVRATVISDVIIFQNPTAGQMFRRGKNYQVNWIGGDENPNYKIELYKNDVKLQSLGDVKGKRSFDWSIPDNTDKGSGYEIRLIDNTSNVKGKQEIKIGSKIPLVLKVAPVLVIGAVVGILSSGGGGGGEEPPVTTTNNLPEPPSPPGN